MIFKIYVSNYYQCDFKIKISFKSIFELNRHKSEINLGRY